MRTIPRQMFEEPLIFRPAVRYLTVQTDITELDNIIESLALFRLELYNNGDPNLARYNKLATRMEQMLEDKWLSGKNICLLIWISQRLGSVQLPLSVELVAGARLGIGANTVTPDITSAHFAQGLPTDMSRQLAFLNFVRNVVPLDFPGHSVMSWACKLRMGPIQFGFSLGGGSFGRIVLAQDEDPLAFHVVRFLFMSMFTKSAAGSMMILWRFATFYLNIILGACCFIMLKRKYESSK